MLYIFGKRNVVPGQNNLFLAILVVLATVSLSRNEISFIKVDLIKIWFTNINWASSSRQNYISRETIEERKSPN